MPQGPAISTISSMADVWDAYRDEIDGVEQQVRKNLDSSVTLVNTVAAHILSSGGKRIRPLLLLLSARLFGDATLILTDVPCAMFVAAGLYFMLHGRDGHWSWYLAAGGALAAGTWTR